MYVKHDVMCSVHFWKYTLHNSRYTLSCILHLTKNFVEIPARIYQIYFLKMTL